MYVCIYMSIFLYEHVYLAHSIAILWVYCDT